MIKSSHRMGVLPSSLSSTEGSERYADIFWMPVDTIAGVLVEIGLKAARTPDRGCFVQVLQPLNPRLTSWEALLQSRRCNLCQLFGRTVYMEPSRRYPQVFDSRI